MKRFIPILMMLLLLTGCGAQSSETTYRQISMEEAVTMMEEETEYIILDVRTAEEYSEKDRLFAQESLSFFVENRERTRNFHHDLRELNHKSRCKAKRGCDILVSELQKSEHKKLTIKNTIVHYSLFLWTFRSRERTCMKSLNHFRARATPLKGSFFKQKGGYGYTINHRGN